MGEGSLGKSERKLPRVSLSAQEDQLVPLVGALPPTMYAKEQ